MLSCFAPLTGCTEAPLRCWLTGGNAFVAGCDWALAALSCGVMAGVGRCYRSRFGGAILLTRSLLRQAASNNAEKRAILGAARRTESWRCAWNCCKLNMMPGNKGQLLKKQSYAVVCKSGSVCVKYLLLLSLKYKNPVIQIEL